MNIFNRTDQSSAYNRTDPSNYNLFPWGEEFLPQNGSVLDVGCGSGNTLNFLLQKNSMLTVVGVDSSLKMLSNSSGLTNLYHAPSDALPFANDSFDVVLSRYAFKWFGKPVSSLKEMRRVLKPSGFLLIWDSGRDEMREVINIIYNELCGCCDSLREVKKYFESIRKDADSVRAHVESVGFRVNKVFEVKSFQEYRSMREFEKLWWQPFGIFYDVKTRIAHDIDGLEKRLLRTIEETDLKFLHHDYGLVARNE